MNRNDFPRLLGDVGGTHARFAWQTDPDAPLSAHGMARCTDHGSLLAAIRHYLAAQALPPPRAGAIGVATAVTSDEVRMTNSDWSFSIRALRQQLGLQRLVVINDFAALAHALPVLDPASVRQLGPGQADTEAPRAVIGPGTGLGVSGWLPTPAGGQALTGEGGHVSLAAGNDREAAVIACLRTRFGHASAERALSGPGLVNLYDALAQVDGRGVGALTPAQVIERGSDGSDTGAAEAVAMFCALLGSVAGDLALTLGARGGVYIGGGIVPRLGGAFGASDFRERFQAKGRFRDYLAAIPTFVIAAEHSPALAGAARALDLAA